MDGFHSSRPAAGSSLDRERLKRTETAPKPARRADAVAKRWNGWLGLALLGTMLGGCTPPPPLSSPHQGDEDLSVTMPNQLDDRSTSVGSLSKIKRPGSPVLGTPKQESSTEPVDGTLAEDLSGAVPGNLPSFGNQPPARMTAARAMPQRSASQASVVGDSGLAPASSQTTAGTEKIASANDLETVASDGAANDAAKIEASPVAGPEDYQQWEQPNVALVFTGNQHGYIEPCGCTGLDRQKGGVARRFTFLDSLREKQWAVVPMDVGNQVRRFGQQAAIKLQQSVRALDEMKYKAVGFGPEDIRLPVGDLLSVAAMEESPDDTLYVSANVVLIDPSLMPQTRVLKEGGTTIGVTSVLDPQSLEAVPSDELVIGEMVPATRTALQAIEKQQPDYTVLLFYGEEERAEMLVRKVPGIDLVVVAGGYGEPTYQAKSIESTQTKMIVTGAKGMYAGVVGLFQSGQAGDPEGASSKKIEMKYSRVALTHELSDSPAMRDLMRDYQDQLRDIGLSGLGLLPPIPHSTGHRFVGTATCGKCHTEAMEVWEGSAHAHATESIVKPPQERGDIARHFDPECISCHVTGWNPQEYYPYKSGYLSIEKTSHLRGNGCENCHGPGAEHAAAEAEGSTVTKLVRDQLRQSMQLPLEKAREKCMTCHDLDNSPDFHEPGAFEDIYWPEVEHSGME